MKSSEKIAARALRAQGFSIKDIVSEIGVAKSSVSLWVRDIVLTSEQQQTLSAKGISKEIIERRRLTRLTRAEAKREVARSAAQQEIRSISDRELWIIGVMLYWGEGGKTQNMARFSNSDPRMITVMMRFFRKICAVPEEKFRCHIHIHPHLDHLEAERYWSAITGVPLTQFYKTYRKMNPSSKHKRDTLPYGTLDVYVCSIALFLKLQGWTNGVVAAVKGT